MTSQLHAATHICQILQAHGHLAVFAGGAVRDRLLGKQPHDYDVATSATPDQVVQLFTHTLSIGKAFGVIVVGIEGEMVEVATLRKDIATDGRKATEVEFSAVSLRDDAERRDFTINGLLLNPITDELLDFVGGINDLVSNVVHFIGDPAKRIEEDKLRMLRAVRFASQLSFTLHSDTKRAIADHASLLTSSVSVERIKMELDKMLLTEKPSIALQLLADCGLLVRILPEVDALCSAHHPSEWHSEGNPWQHTLLVVDEVRKHSDSLIALWGALLHDIGKPSTEMLIDGTWTNHGHDAMGSEMAAEIMLRMKSSTSDVEAVSFIVAKHMVVRRSFEMKKSTKRKLASHSLFDIVKLVSLCDSRSSIPSDNSKKRDDSEWLTPFDELDLSTPMLLPPPLVRGNDLIALGLVPGPIFSIILDQVMEMQLNDELTNRETALDFIKKTFIEEK